jgi:hypothetical protein
MAFIEQRGQWFRIIFKYRGERFTHSLNSTDPEAAQALKGGIEKTIFLLGQRLLHIPDGSDVKEVILTGGQSVVHPLEQSVSTESAPSGEPKPLTLGKLRDRYVETIDIGAVETDSLKTIKMHLRHFERTLGTDFSMSDLGLVQLQGTSTSGQKTRAFATAH